MSFTDYLFIGDTFVLIFVAGSTTSAFLRGRNRTRLSITLLFTCLGLGALLATQPILNITGGRSTMLSVFFMYSKPILLLLLLDQFMNIPKWVMAVIWGAQLVTWGGILAWHPMGAMDYSRVPILVQLATSLYYIPVQIGMTWALLRKRHESKGLTRVRILLAAFGEALFVSGHVFEFLMTQVKLPGVGHDGFLVMFTGSIAGYYLGFASPRGFRRILQSAELRDFLRQGIGRAAFERSDDTSRRLVNSVVRAVGAERVEIAFWNAHLQRLLVWSSELPEATRKPISHGDGVSGEAWRTGRICSYPGPVQPSADETAMMQAADAQGLTVVPIGQGPDRHGLLVVLMRREPLFPEDDEDFFRLVTDQAMLVADLERAFNTLSWYVRMLSHELRNELNPLPTWMEVLRKQSPTELGQELDRLQASIRSMATLMTDLESLAHLQDPNTQWVKKDTDVAETVRQVLIRHLDLFDRAGIEVDASGIPEPPVLVMAQTVPDKLAQVIHNLLENALKHGAEGRWLAVRVLAGPEWVRVEVQDQGKGISPEDVEKIFHPYYRSSDLQGAIASGRGLGLTFIGEVIRRLGGRLGVYAPPQGGVCFWFELPKPDPQK